MLQQSINSWYRFSKSFDFDPEMGYMVSPNHTITSFNYQKLVPILEKINQYRDVVQLQKLFKEFPDLQLKQERNNTDMLILHDSLCFLLQYFLLYCRLINRQIKQSILPKNIAVPLYIASNQINLKYGLCLSVQSNWIPNNANYLSEDFTFQDFQLRATYTMKNEGEKWFFGGSLIASFYLAKMIKLIYEINKIIEIEPMKIQLVVQSLNKIKSYWDKATKQNSRIINQLDKDYFWWDLRPMLGGFQDLIFQGVQNGNNLALSSTGGAGGTDPSFQIFQRGFGVNYDQGFASSQMYLQKSMTGNHIQLIKYFQRSSNLREYCKCFSPLIKAYNGVITAYSQFLKVHSSFIEIFILKYTKESAKNIPKSQTYSGKGGVEINAILKRHEQVLIFLLDQKHSCMVKQCNKVQTSGQRRRNEKLTQFTQASKKQLYKVMAPFEANFKCQQNLYCSKANLAGFINFGVSINLPNMSKIVQYLPSYINVHRCQYSTATGEKKLNQILSKNSPYKYNQTFAMNNLLTLVTMFAQVWPKISIQGNYSELELAQNFSSCQIVAFSESLCHILFYPSQEIISEYLKFQTEKKIVFVVSGPKQVIETNKKNIFYIYEINYSLEFTCGVCYYKDHDAVKQFEGHFMTLQFSTFLSATIEYLQTQGIEILSLKRQLKQTNYKQNFVKLLRHSFNGQIQRQNLHFTIGAGAALMTLGISIFNKGDNVILDKPFYFAFLPDFKKSGIIFDYKDLFEGTLVEKAKEGYQNGAKGYLISNPNNPTGKVYSKSQIIELCEWAKEHKDFHVILDELYHHSIHNDQCSTQTGIRYANVYENIHIIRGLAKDFSLCGFKVGLLVSCNKNLKENFKKWEKIISPQKYLLQAVADMLQRTQFGKLVLRNTKLSLQKANNLTLKLLDQHKIKYIRPDGGCFVILDFRDIVRKCGISQQNLWRILFYRYKLSVSMGMKMGFKEEGYFRMCHIVSQDFIRQGVKRLDQFKRQILESYLRH